jgi:hypothetical protein
MIQSKIHENYTHEEKTNGLIIMEAYYGKEDHIKELC